MLPGYNVKLIKAVRTSEIVWEGKAKGGLKLGLNINIVLKFLEKKYHPKSAI